LGIIVGFTKNHCTVSIEQHSYTLFHIVNFSKFIIYLPSNPEKLFFILKNCEQNVLKIIIAGWNKDVLGGKKITIGEGVIRDSKACIG